MFTTNNIIAFKLAIHNISTSFNNVFAITLLYIYFLREVDKIAIICEIELQQ